MTGGFWRRLTRGEWHGQSQADWAALAPADPDAIMAADLSDRFHAKQGRSIARWDLGVPSRRLVVYIKRHFADSWRKGLAAMLIGPGRSASGREWDHINWAAAQGIPVPRPVAIGERVGPWGRLQSYLAIEELTGMAPLHKAIPHAAAMLSPLLFAGWKRGLVTEVARLTRRLHDLRYFHKDLYLCHFYVPESLILRPPAAWVDQVYLIDWHRLGHHPLTWRWWQMKDLAQLLYSSAVPGVTARDRVRFWRHYAGRPGMWNRVLKWGVRLRWKRYRDHNTARRAAA